MLRLGRNIRWVEMACEIKKMMMSSLIRKYDVIIVISMSGQLGKWKVFTVSLFLDGLS